MRKLILISLKNSLKLVTIYPIHTVMTFIYALLNIVLNLVFWFVLSLFDGTCQCSPTHFHLKKKVVSTSLRSFNNLILSPLTISWMSLHCFFFTHCKSNIIYFNLQIHID